MSVVVAPGKLLTVTRRLAARLNKSLRKPLTIESPTMIVPSLGYNEERSSYTLALRAYFLSFVYKITIIQYRA